MPTPTNKEIELREKWSKIFGASKSEDKWLEYGILEKEIADWWLNEFNLAVQEAEQRGYERAKIERLAKEDLELKVKTGY